MKRNYIIILIAVLLFLLSGQVLGQNYGTLTFRAAISGPGLDNGKIIPDSLCSLSIYATNVGGNTNRITWSSPFLFYGTGGLTTVTWGSLTNTPQPTFVGFWDLFYTTYTESWDGNLTNDIGNGILGDLYNYTGAGFMASYPPDLGEIKILSFSLRVNSISGKLWVKQGDADSVTFDWLFDDPQPVFDSVGWEMRNLPPVVSGIPNQTTAEDSTFTSINLDAYVEDFENADNQITWTYAGNSGLYMSIVNRVATISPPANWNGSETITFTARDPGGLTGSDAATFTVIPVNDSPAVSINNQSIPEGGAFNPINLDDRVSDPDNADSQMTWSYSSTQLIVNIVNRVATVTTPNPDWNGNERITFTAQDPGGLTGFARPRFTVTPVNDPPVVSGIPGQAIPEGGSFTAITLDNYVVDPDNTPSQMTWSYSGNTELIVSITNRVATITVSDPEWKGSETITFTATDPGALSGSDAAVFNVGNGNQPPVLEPIGPKYVNATDTLQFNVSATDPEGGHPVLTISSVPPLPGAATFTDNNNGTGTFEWATSPVDDGIYYVTFYATDDSLAVDSEIVAITVGEEGGVNHPPVITYIGNKSDTEGVYLHFTVHATDPDVGDRLTWTTSTLPTGATFTANGTFDWVPTYIQDEVYDVTFYVTDGQAGDSEKITITIIEAGNQRPTLDSIGPQSIVKNNNLNFTVSGTDPDETIPALTALSLPGTATFTDNHNGTGTFNWTPTEAGVDSITFRASDGTLIDSEIVQIVVFSGPNRPPILNSIGSRSVVLDSTLSFVITAYDSDLTTPALSMVAEDSTTANFVNSGNGSGTFDWTPTRQLDLGDHIFTFYANDGSLTDSEAVTITVTYLNHPPVLNSIGPKEIDEGVNLHFTVTATDSDFTIPTVSSSTLPTGATFVVSHGAVGTFDWTPDYIQAGIYDVTFYATDGEAGDSEKITITIIEAGNQRPVLNLIGPKSIVKDSNLNFSVSATDPDGTTPVLTALSLPGTATFTDNHNGTGTFNWTPTEAGVDSITFRASDGTLSDSEIVQIVVFSGPNRPPVLDSIHSQNAILYNTLNFVITAYDSDLTIPTLSMVAEDSTTADFVDSGNGSGTFDWVPAGRFDLGDHVFTFYANDGSLTDSEIVTITVTYINHPPVLDFIGHKEIDEGVNLHFTVRATDSDFTFPTVSSSTLPTGATFVVGLRSGTFDWTPDYDQSGTYPVTFYATDDSDLVDSEVVQITVNDASGIHNNDSAKVFPDAFMLYQNYPNPFNPTTYIEFDVGHSINGREPARLIVYNILDQHIKTLLNRLMPSGHYSVQWDATDNYGRRVASGIYFYRLEVGSRYLTRKMLLLK